MALNQEWKTSLVFWRATRKLEGPLCKRGPLKTILAKKRKEMRYMELRRRKFFWDSHVLQFRQIWWFGDHCRKMWLHFAECLRCNELTWKNLEQKILFLKINDGIFSFHSQWSSYCWIFAKFWVGFLRTNHCVWMQSWPSSIFTKEIIAPTSSTSFIATRTIN